MTSKKKPMQKLVSFTESQTDISNIEQQLEEGWKIVSILPNEHAYLCVLEKPDSTESSEQSSQSTQLEEEQDKIFIPPRKKIKISA